MKKERFVIWVILSIIIEICVFNFTNVLSILKNDSQIIPTDEMRLNEEYNETGIQWLFDIGSERNIYNIKIDTDKACNPDFYYIDKDGMIQNKPFIKINDTEYMVKVGKKLSGEIGISLYGDASLSAIVLNAGTIHFSIARVIAMILLYIAGTLLFSIQKMPDYKIDSQAETIKETTGGTS
ncbi:hypothetical protein SAMN02910275_02944 [Butyrivibrio sp. INlla18]|uniref:hypothetical protein n=1 Tax=Butyrivibrio sp. INlla18 TaxID=1520806 RepID=UPI00088AFB09|nr:hypothetical protein [Butyrivibrio sp. INlla18]SDA79187.1 hypothetical protein SAMN02910275_02944 [Butyrivibrio sp. INlla18]